MWFQVAEHLRTGFSGLTSAQKLQIFDGVQQDAMTIFRRYGYVDTDWKPENIGLVGTVDFDWEPEKTGLLRGGYEVPRTANSSSGYGGDGGGEVEGRRGGDGVVELEGRRSRGGDPDLNCAFPPRDIRTLLV